MPEEVYGFDAKDIRRIAHAVRAVEAFPDHFRHRIPGVKRRSAITAASQVYRFVVKDRVIDYASGSAVTRLDLVVCSQVPSTEAGGGTASVDGLDYIVYTRRVLDIGESLLAARCINDTAITYTPAASSSGSSSGAAQPVAAHWQATDDGPNIGRIVSAGPNGEPDFTDNRHWVQVQAISARSSSSGGYQPETGQPNWVDMQRGASATPVIVEAVNLACGLHIAGPGELVSVWPVADDSDPANVYWAFERPWDGFVIVRANGGSPGTDCSQINITYDVFASADTMQTLALNQPPSSSSGSGTDSSSNALSPLLNRSLISPANVVITEAPQGSLGIAYLPRGGSWFDLQLLWVQETVTWGP